MIFIEDLSDYHMDRPAAVTLGKFDGIHKGHRKLFDRILEKKKEGMVSVAFTLDMSVFLKEEPLTTVEEKKEILERAGVDVLVNCPFTDEIRRMDAERFLKEILLDKLHMAYAAVGSDYTYGYMKSGNADTLREAAGRYGFVTEVLSKERYNGREISSTGIREALRSGDMETVNGMLGRDFSICEPVVRGFGLGHTMGVPTMNQPLPEGRLMPPDGVYLSLVETEGRIYKAITDLGTKPTVGDGFSRGFETHVPDWDGEDLYGCHVKLRLRSYLRPEIRFPDIGALKEQIEKDLQILKNSF